MNYYSVAIGDDNAWVLGDLFAGDGHRIRGDALTHGGLYAGPPPVRVEVIQPGKSVGFNIETWGVPIVSERIAALIDSVAPGDIQRFKILADDEPLEVLNVTHVEACLDSRCVDLWWTERDSQPERAGEPRMISRIRIDPSRAHGRHVLRVRGWEVAVLVSERVRDELRGVQAVGVRFVSATE